MSPKLDKRAEPLYDLGKLPTEAEPWQLAPIRAVPYSRFFLVILLMTAVVSGALRDHRMFYSELASVGHGRDIMWHMLHISSSGDPNLATSTAELLHSTSRNLITATGIIYLVWHIVSPMIWPDTVVTNVLLITPVFALSSFFAFRLVSKHFLLAQAVWQLGLAAAIALAVYMYRRPEISFIYALLPFLAVITVGWPAGLLVEVLVSALTWWLFHDLVMMQSLSAAYTVQVAVSGALAGIIGWASSHALFTVAHWSLFSFNQARESMDEVLERRAQLVRALKDLDQAYYRLGRANASLTAAWKAADDAERFKTEFVTNVSHELRTPLNLIIGFAEMMTTAPESYGGVQLPGPYRSDMNSVYHSAQHLLALVDDVLDLARIEVGKIALVKDEVDLDTLVSEATGMVREYIAAKGLDLRVHIEDDLPTVWVDRLRVRQVLLNLLVNAARFTERGWISIDVSCQDEEVMVWVKDTGQGISEEDMPKIFEEFRSTEQPFSKWHSGTGLGLPISKQLVELHHGRMGVESAPTRGTAFWFTLPCVPALALRQQPIHPGRRQPTAWTADERIIITLHEDPRVAPLLKRYLGGYQVIGAPSIEEATALADEIKALAVVVDTKNPLPDTPINIPIVRCPLPSGRRAAIALGADDFLVKPVSRRELWSAIERIDRSVQRVLIADDDPEVVRLFKRMLRTRIAVRDCMEAYDGEEALELMKKERPDLVLLDLVMPEVKGDGVLERMAEDAELADIPVIIVSAKSADDARLRLPGPVQISKSEGFQLGEVVRMLEGVLNALAPGWVEAGSRESAPARVPLESPALADTL